MSEITSVAGSALPLESLTSTGSTDMGRDEFMKLLIAQLKYQDPLEPVKNQDFSAQLAQFSQLEQLENMNSAMEESIGIDLVLTQSINNTLAATIIGKDIKAIGDVVSLEEGKPMDLEFNLSDYAEKVTVSILDDDGNVLRTIEQGGLSAGENEITWDGKDSDGNDLETGYYRFEIEALSEDNTEINVDTYINGFVSSVRYENGAAIFQVFGEDIPFSNVLEIGTQDGG